MEITLDTDWGAKGAQLTGSQVQSFIKQQFRELIAKDAELKETNESLKTEISDIDNKINDQLPKIEANGGGCLIAYHRRADNWPCAAPYWEWPEIEAAGERADGVLVLIDGQPPIVVALHETKTLWSKHNFDTDLSVGTDHELAYGDFNGQIRTAKLMSMSEKLFGADEEEAKWYAAPWCYGYSNSYKIYDAENDKEKAVGITENSWWLPSIAELITIMKYKHAINLCLSVISGAMPIHDGWYWSSTEATTTTVWRVHMGDCAIQGNNNKTENIHYVRAISTFYDPQIFNGEFELENAVELIDARIKRYGNVAIYYESEDTKPIAIKYPITEEKLSEAILESKYSAKKIAEISRNYEISKLEGIDPALALEYQQAYIDLQQCYITSQALPKQLIKKKLPI